MNIVRAAVVQDAPVAFDREQTIEKVRVLTTSAAQAGAQLVVFPEAFVSAYPKGVVVGARVGMRTPESIPTVFVEAQQPGSGRAGLDLR